MTFFYVGMYLLEIVYNLYWVAICLEAVFRFSGVVKKAWFSENGLLSLVLPWRCDKSAHCGQQCAVRACFPLVCLWASIGITMRTY